MAKKTTCPITRPEFRSNARPLTITINGQQMEVPVKEFSTGSLGWYLNNKVGIDVGGTKVMVQMGLNFTIVGSKELPMDQVASAGTAEAAPAVEEAA